MHKYLAVLFTLVVLAGCAGGTGTVADDTTGGGDTDITDNRFGWGDIGSGDDEVIDDDSDTDITETPPRTTDTPDVDVSGTIKRSFMVGEALNAELTASGGSGSYVWSIESVRSSTYSFPEWIELGEQADDMVKIVGTAVAGKFKFRVKVCDEADDGNCDKSKTFTVNVSALEVVLPTIQRMECIGQKPVISEEKQGTFPLLIDSGLNKVVHGSFRDGSMNRIFKVTGGSAPYAWKVTFQSRDEVFGCLYKEDEGCYGSDPSSMSDENIRTFFGMDRASLNDPWANSEPLDDDGTRYKVTGSFERGVPMCNGSVMEYACERPTMIHTFPIGIPIPVCDICRNSNQYVGDTMKISVVDACGVSSDIKEYDFVLDPPKEKIGDLDIFVTLHGEDMASDTDNWIQFRLYDEAGNIIAKTAKIYTDEDRSVRWKARFVPEPGLDNKYYDSIYYVRVAMHDAGCGYWFDSDVADVYVTGRYQYLARLDRWNIEVDGNDNAWSCTEGDRWLDDGASYIFRGDESILSMDEDNPIFWHQWNAPRDAGSRSTGAVRVTD